MKQPKPTTVDFETKGIEGRPAYPPIPVSVSIKVWGKKPQFYSWGHPTGNNSTKAKAAAALKAVWGGELLFQNGKFDIDVAETYFKLPMPNWERVHDTMFLLFLDDPHQTDIGLKPSAERLLGMPPDERDEVQDWLLMNQPLFESKGIKISKSKTGGHYFGRYICLAPGTIVEKYANGDTTRTEKLFDLLWKKTVERGMLGAYNRERQLMPILLQMERCGLPVDHQKLAHDVNVYNNSLGKIDTWVIKRLKAISTINLNSPAELIGAMVKAGVVDTGLMPKTPTGKLQTNNEAMLLGVKDKVLLGALKYRTQLRTCMNTFMIPWLETANKSGGFIYTNWNQVKAPSGGASVGTRTGRLSSTPNFQNIPNEFQPIFAHDEPNAGKAKLLPKCPMILPSLPNVRSYIIPFKGEVFVDRDYSQQEPRILAHFDGGALLEKYLENNWIDFHDYAKAELEVMGLFYDRKPVKNTNLGLIYGMGVGKLAIENDMTVLEAGTLKKAILRLYPGLKEMYKDMKTRAKNNEPVRTWGGREYYCEAPELVDGRIREFDYKMVNALIQGSGADCTKEAIIRFHVSKARKPKWKLLLNVHDQLTVSCPMADMVPCMKLLKESMESVEFDVPMLTEGSVSNENWASLVDYDKKGKVL